MHNYCLKTTVKGRAANTTVTVFGAEDIFWTSSTIPLLMIILFFVRHVLTPGLYQHKLIALYPRPEDGEGEGEQVAQTSADTLEDGKETNPLHQPSQVQSSDIFAFFQDKFLILATGSETICRLKWRYWCRSPSFRNKSHDGKFVVQRFLLASVLQGLQFFLYYKTCMAASHQISSCEIGKLQAVGQLTLPMALSVFTLAMFTSELEAARRDEKIKAHSKARIVLTLLRIGLFLISMSNGLILGWVLST